MPSSGVRSAVVLNEKLSASQRQRSFSRGTSGKDDVSCMRTPLPQPGRTYNAPAHDTPMVTRFLPSVNLCRPATDEGSQVLSVTLLPGAQVCGGWLATAQGHVHRTASPLAYPVSAAASPANATWCQHARAPVAGRPGRDFLWCSTHRQ